MLLSVSLRLSISRKIHEELFASKEGSGLNRRLPSGFYTPKEYKGRGQRDGWDNVWIRNSFYLCLLNVKPCCWLPSSEHRLSGQSRKPSSAL